MNTTFLKSTILSLGLLAALTAPALAYTGPGAGLTAIGTVLALIGGVLLAIVGFVWYPIKRMLGGKKSSATAPVTEAPAESEPERQDPPAS